MSSKIITSFVKKSKNARIFRHLVVLRTSVFGGVLSGYKGNCFPLYPSSNEVDNTQHSDRGPKYEVYFGGVAEWLKALVSKTSKGESPSRVQISPPPHLENPPVVA